MILIDDKVVEMGNFPDGSLLIKQDPPCDSEGYRKYDVTIAWKYENDREFLALIYLVKHLRSHEVTDISLWMPYIPNARQDRVKNDEDIFTLKYFAELLNSLNFSRVAVLDPHSNVSTALINNLIVHDPSEEIGIVLDRIGVEHMFCYDHIDFVKPKEKFTLAMFYPDEGAMKRYSSLVNLPYTFGIKKRDWKTGKILGLDVAGDVDEIMGRNILIVDDICSRGGTFLHAAKKLKELGANDIYLYVSHCENTILEGELLTSGLIKKVFTTDSIFTKTHELIEVLK